MTPSRQRDVRFLAIEMPRAGIVEPHSHRVHQLLRVERGALAFTHRVASWVVPTGSAVWLPADSTHRLEALGKTSVAALYVRAREGEDLPRPGPVQMSPLLGVLMHTFARPIIGAERRARLEAVLRDELHDLVPRAFVVALPLDVGARAAALGILADPADDRPVDELAGIANTSVRTLQRRFSAETGLSIQTWRRRARLQHAMALMADGHNVTETAHRCGFASASAFIAAFRSELGVTPAAWRAGGAHV